MASNYQNKFYKDYENLQIKYDKKSLELKIAKDNERRALRLEARKIEQVKTLKLEIKDLKEENKKLQREIERLRSHENIDGTNASIPTSMTPIGKKKIIPNFAKNTGGKIGRKEGHRKDKLERIPDELIDEHIEHKLEECPNCKEHKLIPTGKAIEKDVKDYKIIVENTRHRFIEYKCSCCGKIVHESIPKSLKEECQYGSNVKAVALTLSNVGNVSLNKIRRILNGLSVEEIEPCEGYLVKLQKQASKGLESFIKELHEAIINSEIVYWDDTGISINKKQSCMRYYGNEDICLFKAHEKKNKEGLDKDQILSMLSPNTVVEHDHNKVNYNPKYEFINAECCQHLLRDLRKVEINIPSRI